MEKNNKIETTYCVRKYVRTLALIAEHSLRKLLFYLPMYLRENTPLVEIEVKIKRQPRVT